MELGAQLKHHCEAENKPFAPTVGEPCCAMLPGESFCCTAWGDQYFMGRVGCPPAGGVPAQFLAPSCGNS